MIQIETLVSEIPVASPVVAAASVVRVASIRASAVLVTPAALTGVPTVVAMGVPFPAEATTRLPEAMATAPITALATPAKLTKARRAEVVPAARTPITPILARPAAVMTPSRPRPMAAQDPTALPKPPALTVRLMSVITRLDGAIIVGTPHGPTIMRPLIMAIPVLARTEIQPMGVNGLLQARAAVTQVVAIAITAARLITVVGITARPPKAPTGPLAPIALLTTLTTATPPRTAAHVVPLAVVRTPANAPTKVARAPVLIPGAPTLAESKKPVASPLLSPRPPTAALPTVLGKTPAIKLRALEAVVHRKAGQARRLFWGPPRS